MKLFYAARLRNEEAIEPPNGWRRVYGLVGDCGVWALVVRLMRVGADGAVWVNLA